ncbi:MAG: aspartate/glutamate racemase family protein [Candidatus Aminicenantales bacterium]
MSIEMKFGLIIPSSNTNMEAEFWKMALGWATVHTARARLKEISLENLEEMEVEMLEAALRLADVDIDVLAYGCTTGSLFRGKEHGREIEQKLKKRTGIPAVATAQAMIDALVALKISRVCIATPYNEDINRMEKRFIEQNGIEVLRIQGLGIVENKEVGRKGPDAAYELGLKIFIPETQGIFISCTNFRTIEILDQLENELRVPVISSNTATFWSMMKKAGIQKKLMGYGSLLEKISS